jgi:hypothetical protein
VNKLAELKGCIIKKRKTHVIARKYRSITGKEVREIIVEVHRRTSAKINPVRWVCIFEIELTKEEAKNLSNAIS